MTSEYLIPFPSPRAIVIKRQKNKFEKLAWGSIHDKRACEYRFVIYPSWTDLLVSVKSLIRMNPRSISMYFVRSLVCQLAIFIDIK